MSTGAAAVAIAEIEKRNEEDRKKRRAAEEEKQIREDDRLTRERGVRDKITHKTERVVAETLREARTESRFVERSLMGVDRATETMLRGRGADSATMLGTEAARARDLAAELPKGSTEERVLSALATSLDAHADAFKASSPAAARTAADRLERIAQATEARAEKLATTVEASGKGHELGDREEGAPSDRAGALKDTGRRGGDAREVDAKSGSRGADARKDPSTDRIDLKSTPAKSADAKPRAPEITERIPVDRGPDASRDTRGRDMDARQSPAFAQQTERQAREIPKADGSRLGADARQDRGDTRVDPRSLPADAAAAQKLERQAREVPKAEGSRLGADTRQSDARAPDRSPQPRDTTLVDARAPREAAARSIDRSSATRADAPSSRPADRTTTEPSRAAAADPTAWSSAPSTTIDTRARFLARTQATHPADLLRSLAAETRAQAELLRTAASNTDSLIGRSLARSLAVIVDASVPLYFQRAEGALPKKVDRADVDAALRELKDSLQRFDRHVADVRRPLHDVIARLDPGLADRLKLDGGNTPVNGSVSSAYRSISTHTLTAHLMEPLAALSAAINATSPDAIRAAAKELVSALGDRGQLGFLKAHLGQAATETTRPGLHVSPGDILKNELPSLVLRGALSGGLAAVFDGSAHSAFSQRLKRIAIAEDPSALTPAERLLVNLANGRSPPAASALDPRASVWLSNSSLFAESGRIMASFLADPAAILSKPAVEARDLDRLVRLPGASGESAAFADPRGAVIVRGNDGGLSWHQGFVSTAGERVYFDTQSSEGLMKVTYRRAGDPEALAVRVDVDVSDSASKLRFEADPTQLSRYSPLRETAAEIDDTESVDDRRKVRKGASIQAYAAITAYSPNGTGLFLGIAPKWTARALGAELVSMRARVGVEAPSPFVLESVRDLAFRLRAAGHRGAEAFEDRVALEVEDLGLDPEVTGALVILSPSDSDLRHLERQLRQLGSEAAFFVPADGAPPTVREYPPDPLREYDLIEDGLLIRASRERPANVVID